MSVEPGRPIPPWPGPDLIRVLICPNAFKGSLTASSAARAIEAGLQSADLRGVRLETVRLPLADGGDGTLETLTEATGGTMHTRTVTGPLGAPVEAAWGRLGGSAADIAVIEMAQASGLRLLRPDALDIRRATTRGVGELMRAAFDAGCRTVIVGIGGSATNDGGAGMASALGFRLLDAHGVELEPGGAALARLARIDARHSVIPQDARIIVMSDVDNPLCGPEGAAAVYGPQKGASPAIVAELDAALAHYAAVLRTDLGADVAEVPGAGAAGGLGAGLMAFCGAALRPGTEMALDVTGFDALLAGCRLVITGEGRLDGQTARGKVIAGVSRRAKAAGVPVVALVGSLAEDAEARLREEGLTAALCILEAPCTVDEAMRNGYALLCSAAERLARLMWGCGTPTRG